MLFHIGERIRGQARLTAADIAEFAHRSGDYNPLHHDSDHAQETRFRGIIACGAHMSSLMMGIIATYLSQKGSALGLEFSFRYLRAIKAEETIEMEWEIVTIEPKASLAGAIMTVTGKATTACGEVAVVGTGKVLVTETL